MLTMITVYSEKHLLRNSRTELYGGELVTPHECAQRAEFVLDRVKATGLGDIIAPAQFGLEPLRTQLNLVLSRAVQRALRNRHSGRAQRRHERSGQARSIERDPQLRVLQHLQIPTCNITAK